MSICESMERAQCSRNSKRAGDVPEGRSATRSVPHTACAARVDVPRVLRSFQTEMFVGDFDETSACCDESTCSSVHLHPVLEVASTDDVREERSVTRAHSPGSRAAPVGVPVFPRSYHSKRRVERNSVAPVADGSPGRAGLSFPFRLRPEVELADSQCVRCETSATCAPCDTHADVPISHGLVSWVSERTCTRQAIARGICLKSYTSTK